MRKVFVLSLLTSVALICSCQKQNSAAEQQLAQRKTELDARENELDERENALAEKENAVAERGKAIAHSRIIQSQRQAPDATQAEGERQRRIQQLPPELQALIPERSRLEPDKTEKDFKTQQQAVQRQLGPEDLARQWQHNLDKAKMSGKAVFPAAEPASPTPSPAVEATSPSASPTPE